MRIIAVEPESPLFGQIRRGDRLLTVNGSPVRDNIDCWYKLADDTVTLDFEKTGGDRVTVRIPNPDQTDLGLRFETDKIKVCRNKCIFCFVHQQPRGMRRSLYVRDDDYRLSFTHGNFITLSNIGDEDIERIIEQRLSPLYVSVHTTDDDLRRKMFGNRRLPPVGPTLRCLVEGGIEIHTQVVLCPGINDGAHLEKTIDELFELYPGVASLGVVPVGLTRYRKNLPRLRTYTAPMASAVLDYIHRRQKECLKKGNSRFVFAADEFYILSGRPLPPLAAYETMPQFENGIGMMRSLLTDFNRRRRFLNRPKHPRRMALVTGLLAAGIIKKEIVAYLNRTIPGRIDIYPVTNRFWGKSVTVSGLLTGRDIMATIKLMNRKYDLVLLPPNCLNNDDLFLDDMPLVRLRSEVEPELVVGSYSLIDTLKEIPE